MEEYIDGAEYLVPITGDELCRYVSGVTGDGPEDVRPAVNMALSRLERSRPDFFRFRNGIYYRTKDTVFGPMRLDPGTVIRSKYIIDGDDVIGYETGLSLLNRAGLTTQVPAWLFVASNRHKGRGLIKDGPLHVLLSKPMAKVTKENHLYMQTLELVNMLVEKKDHILSDEPRLLVYEHIKRLGLDAGRLMYHAAECGGGKLADELVRVYREGMGRRHENEMNGTDGGPDGDDIA